MFKKICNWFIDRIPLSTRLYIGRVLIVLLPLLTVAKPTMAFAWLGIGLGALGLTILPALLDIVVGILGSIFDFISLISIAIIDRVILPGQNSLFFSDQIQNVFEIMRNAANVLFFLAILIFAIMIITRTGGYNFKKAISSLVTAVILANLSFTIVLVLVEAGDALRNSVSAFIGDGTLMNMGELWHNLFVPESGPNPFFVFDPGSGTSILVSLATLAVTALGAYVFFRLAFVLVERAVRLIWQAIFGPIVFALSLFPDPSLQKMASGWWSDTIRWVLVLPIAFILISIAQMLLANYTGGPLSSQLHEIITTRNVSDASALIYLIIPIAILIVVADTPKMLELSTSAATKFFTNTVGNFLPNLVGGAAKTGVLNRLKLGGQAIMGGTKAGRWWDRTVTARGKRTADKIAAGQKAREVRIGTETGKMAARDFAKTNKIYKEQFDTYVTQQGADPSDLEPSDEVKYKEKFAQINPSLAEKFETDKTGYITYALSEIERIKGFEYSPEDMAKETYKAAQQLIKLGPNAPQSVRGDFIGLINNLIRNANKSGPAGDHFKNAANALMRKLKDENMPTIKELTGKNYGINHPFPVRFKEFEQETFNATTRYINPGTTADIFGSASKADKIESADSTDIQQLKQWTAEEKHQEFQKAKQDSAQKIGDSNFVATVGSVNNLKGGSAILQIIQKAAESDNLGALKNIASVSELLAKLSPDSEEKILDIQSRYGSDKDSIKTALQSEVGISEEDSKKAADLLSSVGVKDISKVSSVAGSLGESRDEEDGKLKAKIDYIQQVQVTAQTEKEYRESQVTSIPAESTAANEQRIEAAVSDANEPYPLKDIQNDIKQATEQLKKIILQSAQTKDEKLRLYQKQQLEQIQHGSTRQLKTLALKIFGKLKHYHQGSIIDSEKQIDQMTPSNIYKLLKETGAAADKLSGETK